MTRYYTFKVFKKSGNRKIINKGLSLEDAQKEV